MNVGAFCAQAKRKAINNGTKIADVMENTLVTQDCQDAYFGCMDTFCMSENVSGGRCKCNDKNAQFDEIFAQLQSVNQKNYLVHQDATSLLKMGKNADDVYAMTKSFATRKSAEKKKKFVSSGVNQGLFFENEDDEDFEDDDSELIDKLLNKSGDELHVAVASLCSQRVPEKCQSTLSMLRSLYVNKIQSDCAAYENSLKQTQDETNQKLTEAKRSLRDTATEKYQSENKYDLGGCVSEYLSCMQQEDTCGEDFGFCVSLAANDRLKNKNVKLKSEKIGIKLTASTFDQLMSKRPLCDGILEQCVKVKDQVWDEFLLRATPTIAMAEFNAESDLRKNCVSTISECFREKCKNPLGNQKSETASAKDDKKTLNIGYDDCLTDPELYKSLCKVELEPCLIASGGTYEQPQKSSLWGYIVAKLAAMKVGACTKQVRECLLADDACGENYAGCIGMTADAIGRLCDFRKLTACMTENKNDENAVRSYIARVGQGIALEINNSMIQNCENALKTAMVSYCGAENGCPNATIDTGVFKNMMTVEFCNGDKCDADLSKFDDYKEILAGNVSPQVKGKMDLSVMQYSIPTDSNSYDVFFVDGTDVEGADSLANIKTLLNTAYSDMIKAIESDAKVNYCMYGRNTKGINDTHWISKASKDKTNANYPSLTNGTRNTVAQYLLNSLSESYYAAYEDKVETEVKGAIAKISSTLTRLKGTLDEAKKIQQVINENVCKRLTYKNEGSRHGCNGYWDNVSSYDKFTSVCTVKITRYTKGCCGWFCDFDIDWTKTRKYQMPIITQEEMEKAGGDISKATTDEADIIKNTLDGDAKLSDE